LSEERLQILKMLEKGTIDAKEANELLGTLEKRDTVFKNLKQAIKSLNSLKF